jgi:hypothetical protein
MFLIIKAFSHVSFLCRSFLHNYDFIIYNLQVLELKESLCFCVCVCVCVCVWRGKLMT